MSKASYNKLEISVLSALRWEGFLLRGDKTVGAEVGSVAFFARKHG
jgi:hypothetical protein